MRSDADVSEVFRLARQGVPIAEIVRLTRCPRTTVERWLSQGEVAVLALPRAVVGHTDDGECAVRDNVDAEAYAYLLGQYLGDGHIVKTRRGVYRLEIYCCAAYPQIIEECASAIIGVLPANRVGRRHRDGAIAVGCYSKHLPCLFPQHGPGRKHERPLALEDWQEKIALREYPGLFVRGLIHSDGWRGVNQVRGANGARYAYPRYQFSNRSGDIRELFVNACEQLGVECRPMTAYTISVARKKSVALLDEHVGSKR